MSATLQRRIIGGIVAVIVVITCIFLGRWQWSRHVDRSAAVEQVLANYEQDPVDLEEILPRTDALLPADLQWRPVRLEGRFGDPVALIRNRPVDGQPGYHVAQLFHVADGRGTTILVNRGFVIAQEGEEAFTPDATKEVTLLGHVRAAEAADDRDTPAGQGFSFNPAQLFPTAENLVTNAYVIASWQDPPASEQIATLPPPDTDKGSHFSYALQWWFFAGGSVVAFFLLMRREDQHEGIRPARPRRQRSRAEEEEDALIAAWEEGR